jgi:hypothetical protein
LSQILSFSVDFALQFTRGIALSAALMVAKCSTFTLSANFRMFWTGLGLSESRVPLNHPKFRGNFKTSCSFFMNMVISCHFQVPSGNRLHSALEYHHATNGLINEISMGHFQVRKTVSLPEAKSHIIPLFTIVNPLLTHC